MPELPEVETVRAGLAPALTNATVTLDPLAGIDGSHALVFTGNNDLIQPGMLTTPHEKILRVQERGLTGLGRNLDAAAGGEPVFASRLAGAGAQRGDFLTQADR